jgi:uncharacterized FAD-dependent dehydrogenase
LQVGTFGFSQRDNVLFSPEFTSSALEAKVSVNVSTFTRRVFAAGATRPGWFRFCRRRA